jgi:hypothetical protein
MHHNAALKLWATDIEALGRTNIAACLTNSHT